MKTPFLVGNRVYLRALCPEDLDGHYMSWLNDAEVCRYNSHHRFPYTRSQAEHYVSTVAASRENLVLAVVTKAKDLHIGNIALQNVDAISRSAEFAVLLGDKKYWGRGFGAEAAVLLIRHGFEALNLHRIYCGTFAPNEGMRRLAGALGFAQEGQRREAFFKNGAFVDIIEYGLLRGEFELHARGSRARKKS